MLRWEYAAADLDIGERYETDYLRFQGGICGAIRYQMIIDLLVMGVGAWHNLQAWASTVLLGPDMRLTCAMSICTHCENRRYAISGVRPPVLRIERACTDRYLWEMTVS